MMRISRFVSPIAFILAIARRIPGCVQTEGPKLVASSHVACNKAVGDVLEEELLRNVVRRRYMEVPQFLNLSGIKLRMRSLYNLLNLYSHGVQVPPADECKGRATEIRSYRRAVARGQTRDIAKDFKIRWCSHRPRTPSRRSPTGGSGSTSMIATAIRRSASMPGTTSGSSRSRRRRARARRP